jgi:hypothetical protein
MVFDATFAQALARHRIHADVLFDPKGRGRAAERPAGDGGGNRRQPGAETEFEVHLGCSKRWQFRFKDLFDGER